MTKDELMRLTDTHVQFWLRHRAPIWAPTKAKSHHVGNSRLIDACVNAHAEPRRRSDGEAAAGNLLAILRVIRRREELLPHLQRIAIQPGTVVSPGRRAGYARKWAKRILTGKE